MISNPAMANNNKIVCLSVLLLFTIQLSFLIDIVQTRTHPPILCRPDQVFDSNVQKCIRLKHSISALVKDILDNTDSTLPFVHISPDMLNKSATNLPSVVHVSDLFIQNLAFINEANMTDCIAMTACNEHCYSWPERSDEQKEAEQSIIDRFISVQESPKKEDEEDTPDFVRVIMQASKKGIDFAKKLSNSKNPRTTCLGCQNEYSSGCAPMNYAYTVRINALYRKLIESNVSFVNLVPKLTQNHSPEILYYHYSMHFVEQANLTNCYALVSCENTCYLYQATISELGADMVEPPASESALLKNDPNKSKSIDIIHNGALVGYKLAIENKCPECRKQYTKCTDDKYEIAKASAAIFGN